MLSLGIKSYRLNLAVVQVTSFWVAGQIDTSFVFGLLGTNILGVLLCKED